MKKRLLIAILTMAVTVGGAFSLSGCDIIDSLKDTIYGDGNTEQSGGTHDTEQGGTQNPDDSGNPQVPDSGTDSNSGQKPDDNSVPDNEQSKSLDFIFPIENAQIMCGYEFTYDKTLDRYAVHQGIDFEAPKGTDVVAAEDGVVTRLVGDHVLGENYITLTHNSGFATTYKYIIPLQGLKEGDSVKRGEIICTVAEALGMEMNDGEHLHFEMSINGKSIDPASYLDIVKPGATPPVQDDLWEPEESDYLDWAMPMENCNILLAYEFTYDKTLQRYSVHQGFDFKAEVGDFVLAAKSGIITEIVSDHVLGENYVTISHSNGVTSTYKYIAAKKGLKVGDTIKRGDVIGTVTEASGLELENGVHLHFAIKVNGKAVDPSFFLDFEK